MGIHTSVVKSCLVVALLLSIVSCDRYRVTLNDRTLSEPRALLRDVEVEDAALKTCIDQSATDMQIRARDELTTLNCSHAGIGSLNGLEQFGHLQTLNLAHNSLTDIAPLFFLGELVALSLEGNSGIDCAVIDKLARQMPSQASIVYPEQCHQ